MKYLLSILFSVALSSFLVGQTIIRGIVYEEDSETPIPYVYVYAENNEQEGVLSDDNGRFSLELKENTKRVTFIHIAFVKKEVPIKEIVSSEDFTIYLQNNIQNLKEVVVEGNKREDNDKIIQGMLRGFQHSFANYLSLSKGYLLNLGYYDKTCISYIESVGFLYTPKKNSLNEMIFLPYNSRVSDVCYDKVEEPQKISRMEKAYSFRSFRRNLMFFHEKSPIKNWRRYELSILSVDKDKMNVSFQTKKNSSFKCEGTMTFDLKNNIISSINITSLLTLSDLKRVKKGRPIDQESTLKIVFKHFDNKIYYKSFEHNVRYNYVTTNKLNNYLYISLLLDSPNLLASPIYKNPIKNRFTSIFSIYDESLVRSYYDENFWKHNSFMTEAVNLSKIEKDLGGKNALIKQFRKNNLAYVPTTDKLRYKYQDSLFSNGIDYHTMKEKGKKAINIYDYLAMYRITDSIVRPIIEKINDQEEISWTK